MDVKKKLKIGDSPIKYLMRFYVPLMITFLKPEEVEEWFCSAYILNKVKKNTLDKWMICQNYNPFIIRLPLFLLSFKIVPSKVKIKVFYYLIQKEFYIFMDVDLYHLKKSFYYKKKHFYHSVLLYGYDSSKNIVNLSGYCFGSQIQNLEVDINDFAASIKFCKNNKIWIYKRRNNKTIKFNERLFFLGVKSYATAKCPLEYQLRTKSFSINSKEYFGIDTHLEMEKNLKHILNGQNDEDLTGRIFAYLEMSQCMVKRLDILQKNKIRWNLDVFKIGFIELSNNYRKMLNLYIKYKLTGNVRVLEKIVELENIIVGKERKLYMDLYCFLREGYNWN